jgi:hypothetical protein
MTFGDITYLRFSVPWGQQQYDQSIIIIIIIIICGVGLSP